MMPPYLSNFEQIHHEAIRLAGYRMNEIRNMDEEYIINACCACVAVAYTKIQKYAEKYFGGFSSKINLFYPKLYQGRYYFESGNISINPNVIFSKEECFNEVLLHELTHSIYYDHSIEFFQHLQHLLYLEGLIKEKKDFRICEQSGSYAVYYGDSRINNGKRIMMRFIETGGGCWSDNIESLFRRVFYYQDILRYRKTGTSSYLIDDNNNFISMEPIWRKYALRYNIEPIFLLQMSCMDEDRIRKNAVNFNNYETFKPHRKSVLES